MAFFRTRKAVIKNNLLLVAFLIMRQLCDYMCRVVPAMAVWGVGAVWGAGAMMCDYMQGINGSSR